MPNPDSWANNRDSTAFFLDRNAAPEVALASRMRASRAFYQFNSSQFNIIRFYTLMAVSVFWHETIDHVTDTFYAKNLGDFYLIATILKLDWWPIWIKLIIGIVIDFNLIVFIITKKVSIFFIKKYI